MSFFGDWAVVIVIGIGLWIYLSSPYERGFLAGVKAERLRRGIEDGRVGIDEMRLGEGRKAP